jgi:hypothetical protein
LEDPGVEGRIILRWIFKNDFGSIDWINLAQDSDRCVNEPSGSIKCGEFLDWLRTC